MLPTSALKHAPALTVALVFLAVLAGCQAFPLKQPPTPASDASSQACAAQCELPKSQCEARQTLREQECQQFFTQANIDYTDCITNGKRNCLQPVSCLGADMNVCQVQNQECILDCQDRDRMNQGASLETNQPNPEPMPDAEPGKSS